MEKLNAHPIVFLDACNTSTQQPFYYDGFIPFFIEERGARGFFGTEVQTPQLLAHAFALEFFKRLAKGEAVGHILWELRRHFLRTHHTILAFNYTLYGLDEIALGKER